VLAQGSIGRGEGGRGISAEGMGALLDGLREDEAVRGVLLRIDSPGGDALASDLLHRRIEALVDVKPVVVSMGDVAASGGYYMAAAADQIFAEAGTVTGSIGVVGGKLNLEGLYERLGISKDGVQHGARAGLLSEARGFTPDERAAVRREMESMYETFLDRVGAGRQLDRKALDAVAQGRIFSGREAQGRGLVDTLGGPLEALRALEGLAGFSPDEPYALLTLPRPQRLPEWVGQALGSGGLARWKAYLGARWLLA
jgi:protease-4